LEPCRGVSRVWPSSFSTFPPTSMSCSLSVCDPFQVRSFSRASPFSPKGWQSQPLRPGFFPPPPFSLEIKRSQTYFLTNCLIYSSSVHYHRLFPLPLLSHQNLLAHTHFSLVLVRVSPPSPSPFLPFKSGLLLPHYYLDTPSGESARSPQVQLEDLVPTRISCPFFCEPLPPPPFPFSSAPLRCLPSFSLGAVPIFILPSALPPNARGLQHLSELLSSPFSPEVHPLSAFFIAPFTTGTLSMHRQLLTACWFGSFPSMSYLSPVPLSSTSLLNCLVLWIGIGFVPSVIFMEVFPPVFSLTFSNSFSGIQMFGSDFFSPIFFVSV